jgi:predicted Zn finger-like uncharacterized protein
MEINASCPNCGTTFTVRRELIGKRAKCPKCGSPFVISETANAQTPSAGSSSRPEPAGVPDMPTYPPTAPPRAPTDTVGLRGFPGEAFGFETDQSRPRFPALRIVARAYEVMAILVLGVAAILFVLFIIAVIRQPSGILGAILGSGLTFFWAAVTALMLLFIAQTIRLWLQIEQNTKETQQACRELADHLCSVESEV